MTNMRTDDDRTIPFAVSRSGLLVVLAGDRLQAACVARGWSLAELARRAKVSRPTLRCALRKQGVRPRTAWKLARALREGTIPPELDEVIGAA